MRYKDVNLNNRIYPIISYFTQLFNNGKLPFVELIALLLYRHDPFKISKDKFKLVEVSLITKVLKNYLKTGLFLSGQLELEKVRFYGVLNVLNLKAVMTNRIKNSIRTIMINDNINNRVHILDRIISPIALETYYQSLINDNKSLELDKELTER
jgi:hypothetical protein